MTALDEVQSHFEVQVDKLRKDLESLRSRLEDVSETAVSEDGLVAATVGARGELRELVLDPRIYRTTDAKALTATIINTMRDATAAVTARMLELAEPMLPAPVRGADGRVDFDALLKQVAGGGR